MRTASLMLGYLCNEDGEEEKLAEAARAISDLTHLEADAGDGYVLWCVAIRHAVLTGELDVLRGLEMLDLDRRELWAERLVRAEHAEPVDLTGSNG